MSIMANLINGSLRNLNLAMDLRQRTLHKTLRSERMLSMRRCSPMIIMTCVSLRKRISCNNE